MKTLQNSPRVAIFRPLGEPRRRLLFPLLPLDGGGDGDHAVVRCRARDVVVPLLDDGNVVVIIVGGGGASDKSLGARDAAPLVSGQRRRLEKFDFKTINYLSAAFGSIQGASSGHAPVFSWHLIEVFHRLIDSAWVLENLAEAAQQLGITV